jgi:hypothetical protein
MARSPRKRTAKVPEGKLRKLSGHLKAGHKALSKSPLFSKNKRGKGKLSPAQVDKELAAVLKKVRSKLQQAEKLLKSPLAKKREPEPADVADVADDELDDELDDEPREEEVGEEDA